MSLVKPNNTTIGALVDPMVQQQGASIRDCSSTPGARTSEEHYNLFNTRLTHVVVAWKRIAPSQCRRRATPWRRPARTGRSGARGRTVPTKGARTATPRWRRQRSQRRWRPQPGQGRPHTCTRSKAVELAPPHGLNRIGEVRDAVNEQRDRRALLATPPLGGTNYASPQATPQQLS